MQALIFNQKMPYVPLRHDLGIVMCLPSGVIYKIAPRKLLGAIFGHETILDFKDCFIFIFWNVRDKQEVPFLSTNYSVSPFSRAT